MDYSENEIDNYQNDPDHEINFGPDTLEAKIGSLANAYEKLMEKSDEILWNTLFGY